MAEADDRFTDIFRGMTARQSTLLAFRDIAGEGLIHARPAVHKKWQEWANSLFTDPQYNNLFIDKEKAKQAEGGAVGLGRTAAEAQIAKFQASVDAASLVFAHSLLDGIVMDYCRLTALAAPGRWGSYVANRKVALADLAGKSYEEVANAKIKDLLEELERESLLTKCDRMFEVCRPGKDFEGPAGYNYDRDRLKSIDNIRHDIIHGGSDLKPVRDIDDHVWFLIQTGTYFMGMVNYAFDLKIDPLRFTPPKTPS